MPKRRVIIEKILKRPLVLGDEDTLEIYLTLTILPEKKKKTKEVNR